MQHEAEFNAFLKALEEQGIKLPPFVGEGGVFDAGIYASTLITSSATLDLEAKLACIFSMKLPETFHMAEFTSSGGIPHTYVPQLFWSVLKDTDGVNDELPEAWHELPKKYGDLSTAIERVDAFLAQDMFGAYAQSQRNSRIVPGRSWNTAYSELVTQGKLRWADLLGEQFPYVLTTTKDLLNVGRAVGGLFFVAKDVASEDWQEQVVAYHERFCQDLGHEAALQKEQELVRHLGKEVAYRQWRDHIAALTDDGHYFT